MPLIDRFRLGYANRTLGYRLPKKNLMAGAEVRGRLQKLGILRASGHEHFSGSLVVPIIGDRGAIAQCYGRKITSHLRAGTPDHRYLPGPHTAVWNVEALADSKEIILCEALVDAMSFWVAGYTNVIASYGITGFLDAHRAALRLHGTERVLIAYDADTAGDRAAEQLAHELMKMNIEAYRVHFPRASEVNDANAYAVANPPASESLGALIRGATWIGRGSGEIAPRAVRGPAPLAHNAPLCALVLARRPTRAFGLYITGGYANLGRGQGMCSLAKLAARERRWETAAVSNGGTRHTISSSQRNKVERTEA